jgi:hypothetical protein
MRLRKNLIQGIEALALMALCHTTGADGAATILFIISIGLLFGKTEKPPV